MKIKPVTYFLCAVSLLLIAMSPLAILSLYDETPDNAHYKGILILWHITDWRTGGFSSASFIKKRIAAFEAKNPYLFIEMQNMSMSDAKVALLRGETPDIISYPLGFDPGFSLSTLPPKENIYQDLSNNSYAYMCGGYCIIVNTDMLDEQGVYVSEGWGIRPDELLSAAQFGICFDSEDNYSSLPSVALHTYPAATGPNISTWGEPKLPDAALCLSEAEFSDGLQAFTQGNCGVLIACQRQLCDLEQMYGNGEAPAFAAYAIGGYTDMVQLISVASCEDDLKRSVLTVFAEYLVSDSSQKQLEPYGVFPVVSNLDIYQENECLGAMYRLLTESAALATPQQKTTLDALAMQSFNGDRKTLKKLRQLLRKSY